MTTRLFAAIFPPPQLIERLEDYVGPRRETDHRLNWVLPEQWHLTTLFIGDCPERSIEPVLGRLGEIAARATPFRVRLGGAGCFRTRPRSGCSTCRWPTGPTNSPT